MDIIGWSLQFDSAGFYRGLVAMLRRLWAAKSLANRKAKGVSPVICPNEHGTMEIVRRASKNTFRGMVIRYDTEFWACDVCGLEVEVLRLAAENQRALSDGYRIAADLLPGREIVEERKRLGWSQDKLARAVNVGVASVKRGERGQIQTPVMDRALRSVFDGMPDNWDFQTGNRLLSLGRIKLVFTSLGKVLKRDLLEDRGNRLLHAAK